MAEFDPTGPDAILIRQEYANAGIGQPSDADVENHLAGGGNIATIRASIRDSAQATDVRLAGERERVESRFDSSTQFTPNAFDEATISRFTPRPSSQFQGIMDATAFSATRGPIGQALRGEDFFSPLADVQQMRRGRFETEIAPGILNAYAGGPGGQGATNSGAARGAISRARMGLAEKEATERFDERGNIFKRAVTATSQLPNIQNVVDDRKHKQQGFINAFNLWGKENDLDLQGSVLALKRASELAAIQESFEGQSVIREELNIDRDRLAANIQAQEKARKAAKKGQVGEIIGGVVGAIGGGIAGGPMGAVQGAAVGSRAGGQIAGGNYAGAISTVAEPIYAEQERANAKKDRDDFYDNILNRNRSRNPITEEGSVTDEDGNEWTIEIEEMFER